MKNCSSVAITKHQYVSNFRICNEEVKAIFSLSQNALKILLCDQNLMRYVTLAHRYCWAITSFWRSQPLNFVICSNKEKEMLRKKLIISISYGYRLRLNVYLRSISQIITEEDYNKKLLKNKSNMVDKYLFFIILSISTKTFYRVASWAHNILTTVTKNIVVDKNTDHNKQWPRSIC